MGDFFSVTTMVLITWFILVAVKKIVSKKGDIDMLLVFTAILAYVLFMRLALAPVPEIYIDGFVYGGFLYTLLMIDIKNFSDKDKKTEKLKALKKEHESVKERSELLRQRFITMLDLFDDGIAFRTDDDMMYGTGQYLNLIPFDTNEFSFESFLLKMHPDDRTPYLETVEKTSTKKPKYNTHYRIKNDKEYLWVKEKGIRMKHQKKTMFITMVKGLDVKKYPETNVDVLNLLAIDRAYYEHLQEMNKKKTPFTIVAFELSNIPNINRRYGRDIGDLMMGEFLSKLAYHFLKDIHSVFRLTGIRFAMVITDHRKLEMLKRALENGGDLVNYAMQFGHVRESVYPSFGIHHVKVFEEPVDEIADRVIKALNIALDDKTPENYFIIR